MKQLLLDQEIKGFIGTLSSPPSSLYVWLLHDGLGTVLSRHIHA